MIIMNKSSGRGFVHSIKVPRIYKTASVIVKKVVEEGGNLKNLVYSSGHKNIKGIYALVAETIKHARELDGLLKSSKLLQNEKRLQPWLARILLTELLFGKKELKGESKPVQTILSYRKQLEKLLNNKKKSVVETVTVKKPRYVRVNTLYHTPDEIIKYFRNEGWTFIPPSSDYSEFFQTISSLNDESFTRDFHINELLVFPGSVQLYNNEFYQKGSILLQDKASCLPASLLKPRSSSVVLDMCAAPGMKTTHLSALMRNKGKIYATEMDSNRYEVLCNLIKKAGCTNVTPLNMDALMLNGCDDESKTDLSWCQDVEYILVDPSCSGSGIVDRVNIFSNEKVDSKRLKKLCGFQFKLLKHALTKFPKVKRVVYSTCSVQPQENEKVVEDVLKQLNNSNETVNENEAKHSLSQFKLAEPLKETWVRRGRDEFEHGHCYIFSDPEKDLTNGFFIAVFERINYEMDTVLENKDGEKKKVKAGSELNGDKVEKTNDVDDSVEPEKKKRRKKSGEMKKKFLPTPDVHIGQEVEDESKKSELRETVLEGVSGLENCSGHSSKKKRKRKHETKADW